MFFDLYLFNNLIIFVLLSSSASSLANYRKYLVKYVVHAIFGNTILEMSVHTAVCDLLAFLGSLLHESIVIRAAIAVMVMSDVNRKSESMRFKSAFRAHSFS